MALVDTLTEAGIVFLGEGQHHHARAGWVQLKNCPWCGSQSYHLGVSLQGFGCSCWKCGKHSLYKTLLELGVSAQALHAVYKSTPRQTQEKQAVTRLKEPARLGPLLPAHNRYLRSRGYDPKEIVRLWGAKGLGPDGGRLAWRIYIPVVMRDKVCAWTARAIGPNVSQRYLSNSPRKDGGVNVKDTVYGLQHVTHSAVIVEGPLDAWAVGPGAVATFGTAFTSRQVLLLSKIPYRYICFDNELEASHKAEELAQMLSHFPGTTAVISIDAKDPGSASKKELHLLRKTAGL